MADPALPAWLTAPDVERAIRALPGFDDASLLQWSGGPLAGGDGECLGVWRLEGFAIPGREVRRWSIVLKGWAGHGSDDPPSTWNWPYREKELDRSGMFANLPGGIRAPRCFGDLERDDGSVWVWLEEITDGRQAPWPIEWYGTNRTPPFGKSHPNESRLPRLHGIPLVKKFTKSGAEGRWCSGQAMESQR